MGEGKFQVSIVACAAFLQIRNSSKGQEETDSSTAIVIVSLF